jgi:NAD(P)-dependent dehydrogenase (short-subunit alcohol dehydrogenase family)
MNFTGHNAIVTGAGGGMGLATALQLLEAGATVTGVDLKEKPTELDAHGDKVTYVTGDVSDDAFVSQAVRESCERAGRLDHLVNSAAVLWFGKDMGLVGLDLDVFDRVLEINLRGPLQFAKHAIPLMQKSGGGSMVHISTIQCLRGDTAPQEGYQTSKAGLVALSKSIAIQYAKDQIRSNVIYPGPCFTPMQDRWVDDDATQKAIADFVPIGRIGNADDMANAVTFLLSEKASFITGTELIVDGGVTALP